MDGDAVKCYSCSSDPCLCEERPKLGMMTADEIEAAADPLCVTCGKPIEQYGEEWLHADGVIYRHVARPVSGSAEGQRAGE